MRLAAFLLVLVCNLTTDAAERPQGTKPGVVYVTPRGQIYYRDPIQTPRWKKGFDVKIRTQTVTLPNNGGSLLLNRYYSE